VSQLVITPVITRHIEALAARAYAEPLTFHHNRRLHLRAEWPLEILSRRQLDVPYGYNLRFSTADYRPGWRCRHLRITGSGKWPDINDVRRLMALFGFRASLEECLTFADGPAQRRSVNCVEPLSGDWSPMRND
jgi:hypothetical protein